jgi:hypothetical protein
MATLVSPGVSISVSDESFYAPAGAGTVPLIVIATAQDKTSPDGTSIAAYTTKATAGKLYQITSQRELIQGFGNPEFKMSNGTPVHGDELNEYGLMAAHSFLGLSNRAYILRADIDLGQLEPLSQAPSGDPADGTYWLNINDTIWGMKQYNASTSKWESIASSVKTVSAGNIGVDGTPKSSFGKNNEICVKYNDNDGSESSTITLWQKVDNVWYLIGSSAWQSASSKDFQWATHLGLPNTRSNTNTLETGDLMLQYSTPNNGSYMDLTVFDSTAGQYVAEPALLRGYSSSAISIYGDDLVKGSVWADVNIEEGVAEVRVKSWNGESQVVVESSVAVDPLTTAVLDSNTVAFSFKIGSDATPSIDVYLTSQTDGNVTVDDIVTDIQSALSAADADTLADSVEVSSVDGKVRFVSEMYDIILQEGGLAFSLSQINVSAGTSSNWEPIAINPGTEGETGSTVDGTIWYDPDISADNIDLLVHDGDDWVTFTGDFQSKATEPTEQSDDGSLQDGDVWLNTADTENLSMHRYNATDSAWEMIDLTDQSSPEGILFMDAREDSLANLDSDSPRPELYPQGMLLWNTRASGGNVKKWVKDFTHEGVYVGGRWTNFSGNQIDGAPLLLRKAQRRAVVRSMQAAVVANDEIRNEVNRFNLMAVPGYPELTDEMFTLAADRKNTVFALIDPPFRLSADATSVSNWVNNAANAGENGEDGLLSRTSDAAVYYPHALTTNLDGTNIMVPASHMALRTYAFNDQVAFPWFAPAGFQRGLVDNATSVGYLDPLEGEYTPVSANEGQRDAYYLNNINPVANFPGRGITIFGQKTLNPTASALDRVNVARLVIYLREILDDTVKPFLFEPNDSVTRANAKLAVDRLLSELVTQRGLYDFLSVCDESNNTPARIDRNELHIDIAIQPVKAVEFIYIPIRIQNTMGETG